MNKYIKTRLFIIVALAIIPFTFQTLLAQEESTKISYEDAYKVLLEVDANPKYKGLIYYDYYEEGKIEGHLYISSNEVNEAYLDKRRPLKDYVKELLKGHEDVYSSVDELRKDLEELYDFVYKMNNCKTEFSSIVGVGKKIIKDDNQYVDYEFTCQPDTIFLRTRVCDKDYFIKKDKDYDELLVNFVNEIKRISESFPTHVDPSVVAKYKDDGLSYRDFLIKKCDGDDILQYADTRDWRLKMAALDYAKGLNDSQKKAIFYNLYDEMVKTRNWSRKQEYYRLLNKINDFNTLGYSYIKDTPVIEYNHEEFEIPDGKLYAKNLLGCVSVDSLYQLYRYMRLSEKPLASKTENIFSEIYQNKRLKKFYKDDFALNRYKWIPNNYEEGVNFAKRILANPSVLSEVGKLNDTQKDTFLKNFEEYISDYNFYNFCIDNYTKHVNKFIKDEKREEYSYWWFQSKIKSWGFDNYKGPSFEDVNSFSEAFNIKYIQRVQHLKLNYKDSDPEHMIYCGKNEVYIFGRFRYKHYFRLKDGRWAISRKAFDDHQDDKLNFYFYNNNSYEFCELGDLKNEIDNIENSKDMEHLAQIREFTDSYTEVYSKGITRNMIPYLGVEYTTKNGQRLISVAGIMQFPVDMIGTFYQKEGLVKRDLEEDPMETLSHFMYEGSGKSTLEKTYVPGWGYFSTYSVEGEGGSVIYKKPKVGIFTPDADINDYLFATGVYYAKTDGERRFIDTLPYEDFMKLKNEYMPKLEAIFEKKARNEVEKDNKSEFESYAKKYGASQARTFLNNNKQVFKGMSIELFQDHFVNSVVKQSSNGSTILRDGYNGWYYFFNGKLDHWKYQ